MSGVPGGEEAAGTQSNRARGITSDEFPIPEDVIGSGAPSVEGLCGDGAQSKEPVESPANATQVPVGSTVLAHYQPPRFPSAASVLQLNVPMDR